MFNNFFTNQQQPQQQQQPPNPFGAAQPTGTGAFGATGFGTGSNAFGNTAPSFGAPSTTPAFGSSNTGFGSVPSSTTSFGAPSSTSTFGAGFGTNSFAAAPPSNTAFGQASSTPFGGGSTVFGSAAPTTSFGTNTATTGFGSMGGGFGSTASNQSGFGVTQPAANPFGAPSTSTFGGSNTSGFGGNTSGFGTANTGGSFGTSSTTFGQPQGGFGTSTFGTTNAFNQQPSQSGFGSFGGTANTTGFMTTGTASPPCTDTSEIDNGSTVIMKSISAMPAYKQKCFEELRLEDYLKGRKPNQLSQMASTASSITPSGTFSFGTAPSANPAPTTSFSSFGSTQPGTTGSLFGSTSAAPSTSTSTFGSFPSSSTSAFGQPAAATTSTSNTFGGGFNFGQASTSNPVTTTTTTSSLFPSTSTTSSLSTAPTSTFSFGQPTATTSTTGLFSQPSTTTSLFSNTNTTNPLTSNTSSLFQPSSTTTTGTSSLFPSFQNNSASMNTGNSLFSTNTNAMSNAGIGTLSANIDAKPMSTPLFQIDIPSSTSAMKDKLSLSSAPISTPLKMTTPKQPKVKSRLLPTPSSTFANIEQRKSLKKLIIEQPKQVNGSTEPAQSILNTPIKSTPSRIRGATPFFDTKAAPFFDLKPSNAASFMDKIEQPSSASAKNENESASFEAVNGMIFKPSLSQLRSMSVNQLKNVSFSVEHPQFGKIEYLSPLNLSCTNVSKIPSVFVFSSKEVTVYPEGDDKVPVGTEFNAPAKITLFKCWPIDKATRQPIKEMNEKLKKHIERLEQVEETEFVDYVPSEGAWIFCVKHFSKYGVPDEEDEEKDAQVEHLSTEQSSAGKSFVKPDTLYTELSVKASEKSFFKPEISFVNDFQMEDVEPVQKRTFDLNIDSRIIVDSSFFLGRSFRPCFTKNQIVIPSQSFICSHSIENPFDKDSIYSQSVFEFTDCLFQSKPDDFIVRERLAVFFMKPEVKKLFGIHGNSNNSCLDFLLSGDVDNAAMKAMEEGNLYLSTVLSQLYLPQRPLCVVDIKSSLIWSIVNGNLDESLFYCHTSIHSLAFLIWFMPSTSMNEIFSKWNTIIPSNARGDLFYELLSLYVNGKFSPKIKQTHLADSSLLICSVLQKLNNFDGGERFLALNSFLPLDLQYRINFGQGNMDMIGNDAHVFNQNRLFSSRYHGDAIEELEALLCLQEHQEATLLLEKMAPKWFLENKNELLDRFLDKIQNLSPKLLIFKQFSKELLQTLSNVDIDYRACLEVICRSKRLSMDEKLKLQELRVLSNSQILTAIQSS